MTLEVYDKNGFIKTNDFASQDTPRFFGQKAAAQSIVTSGSVAFTAITWTEEIFKQGGVTHSNSTNPERIQVPSGGLYVLCGAIHIRDSNTGMRAVAWSVNGGGQVYAIHISCAGSGGTVLPFSCGVVLNAGDYVTVFGQQSSGNTLTIDSEHTYVSLCKV